VMEEGDPQDGMPLREVSDDVIVRGGRGRHEARPG
jgi:hypothetical protein